MRRRRRAQTSASPSIAFRSRRARRCWTASRRTGSSSAPTRTARAAYARCSPRTATAAAPASPASPTPGTATPAPAGVRGRQPTASCTRSRAMLEASIAIETGVARRAGPSRRPISAARSARAAPADTASATAEELKRKRLAGCAFRRFDEYERALAELEAERRARARARARQQLSPGRTNWISGTMQSGEVRAGSGPPRRCPRAGSSGPSGPRPRPSRSSAWRRSRGRGRSPGRRRWPAPCGRLAQPDHAELGRRIGGEPALAVLAGDRGSVEHERLPCSAPASFSIGIASRAAGRHRAG